MATTESKNIIKTKIDNLTSKVIDPSNVKTVFNEAINICNIIDSTIIGLYDEILRAKEREDEIIKTISEAIVDKSDIMKSKYGPELLKSKNYMITRYEDIKEWSVIKSSFGWSIAKRLYVAYDVTRGYEVQKELIEGQRELTKQNMSDFKEVQKSLTEGFVTGMKYMADKLDLLIAGRIPITKKPKEKLDEEDEPIVVKKKKNWTLGGKTKEQRMEIFEEIKEQHEDWKRADIARNSDVSDKTVATYLKQCEMEELFPIK